jgi:nitronate monooxygenase
MHEGTMEVGAWSCGMVAGLVNDIPTVEELMHSIMAEADSIIKERLSKF